MNRKQKTAIRVVVDIAVLSIVYGFTRSWWQTVVIALLFVIMEEVQDWSRR